MEPSEDRLYLGGPDLAERLFGSREKSAVRKIYRLCELPLDRRPSFLKRIGNQPAAFERHIQAFGGQPVAVEDANLARTASEAPDLKAPRMQAARPSVG